MSIIYNLCKRAVKIREMYLRIEIDGSLYYNITLRNAIDLRKIFKARISIVFWSLSSCFSSYFSDWKSRKQLTKNVGRRFRWRRWSFIFRSWMENKVRASRKWNISREIEKLCDEVDQILRIFEFKITSLKIIKLYLLLEIVEILRYCKWNVFDC